MKTTLRKMYAKIEDKIRNKFWEIELLIFFKLQKIYKQEACRPDSSAIYN